MAGYEIVNSGAVAAGPLQFTTGVATCSPGKRVVGGGFSNPVLLPIVASMPDTSWDAWVGRVFNNAVLTGFFHVYAICVDA
jgi:hypothetical protein